MSFSKGSFAGCIADTLKVLLVTTVVFLALVSALLLYGGLGIQAVTSLVGVGATDTSTTEVVCLAIYQVSLALLGIHGAVFRHQNSLKLFTLLSGLNVILVTYLASSVSLNLDETSRETINRLDRLQSKFDWTTEPTSNSTSKDPEVRDATHIWNKVQSNLHCCGLRTFDWGGTASDEPAHSNPKVFPSSCCPAGHMAHMDGRYLCPVGRGIYRTPCVRIIQGLSNMTKELTYGLILPNLFVSLMASVVLLCGPKVKKEFANLQILSI